MQKELKTEQETLQEQQFNRYLEEQKSILSSIQQDYETALDRYLEDTARVITDSISEVNKNATEIGKTLAKEADDVGYDITDKLDKIWTEEGKKLGDGFDDVAENVEKENGTLTDIQKDTETLITNQRDSIVGELQKLTATESPLSNLSGIKSVLTEISSKIDGIGTGGSGDSGNEGSQTPTPQPTGSGNGKEPEIKTGNGGNFTPGDVLKNVTGKWYSASDGTGNNNPVDIYGINSWTIDKINEGSKYPYHIIGYKNGTKKGSGWVKKNQLAYKKGAKRIGYDQGAWTQENGTEYIIRPSDGAILTPLAQGDSVLTSEASKNLWNMANNPMEFIKDNLTVSVPNVTTNSSGGTVENTIQMSISLPGVTNYQEFVTRLQSDKKFEKMIVDVTSSALTGSNSLAKYRHNF